VLVVVAVGGGLAVNALMKLAFHRARPVFDDPLLTLSSYSFPSGHVAGSTIFYGLAVLWLFSHTRRPLWRALALATAVLVIVVVAFSRMVLGVHYLSDVVAAFAEGVAWLAICVGALTAFWREAPPEARPEAKAP
jgi:undecaprenyl-diphosphatase